VENIFFSQRRKERKVRTIKPKVDAVSRILGDQGICPIADKLLGVLARERTLAFHSSFDAQYMLKSR
jgi:hypothetical protein